MCNDTAKCSVKPSTLAAMHLASLSNKARNVDSGAAAGKPDGLVDSD